MVTYASGEVRRQGMLLRRNVFYEGEVMKLLETLVKAYEPFRMPSSYMADCVTMTHAVLNQLEGFAADGSMVVSRRKKKKKKAAAAAAAAGGELPEGGAAAEADDDADAEAEAEAETFAEEVEFDFEKALYDFAHQHAVIERYVMMLRRFTELSPEVTSAVIAFLWRLIEKCNLEPMLYQLQVTRPLPPPPPAGWYCWGML